METALVAGAVVADSVSRKKICGMLGEMHVVSGRLGALAA